MACRTTRVACESQAYATMIEIKHWPNGAKIRQLRESKDWSQFDMELEILNRFDSLSPQDQARSTKCSKKTLEDAEKCRHRITESKLETIADVLGVKIEEIISPTPASQQVKGNPTPHLLSVPLGLAPAKPSLFVGRIDALRELKSRLGIMGNRREASRLQIVTAVRGWPGIGKSTIVAALAHDEDVKSAFPDGVLWASLGQKPDLLSELATWGRALRTDDLLHCRGPREASARLVRLLQNKRMLLIVDDAWEAYHVIPFQVGGSGSAMLVTTRELGVANAIAPAAANVYRLGLLTDDESLELLEKLAPSVVAEYPKESLSLVRELEGLPLGIRVAGRLLNAESEGKFGVKELLADLRAGKKILKAQAPADLTDLAKDTIPSVAVLLQKSTDRLDPATRELYCYLGAFPPKPAMFELDDMQAIWRVEDPKPTVRILVERGLLEWNKGKGLYYMHALLVLHARSLCNPGV